MPQHSLLFSYFLVAVQLTTAALIFLTGPWFAQQWWLLAIELLGVALGLWAIIIIRVGNFNITPEIVDNGRLVRRGPYRLIRHPMYLALLLSTLALVIDSFSILRLSFWIILLVDLIAKLTYEERLLVLARDEYRHYKQTTKRLIPFVF